MKSKLLLMITSLCIVSLWTEHACSWDFPLTMDVLAIKFDHRIDGINGALDICKNTSTNIHVPEYDTGAQRNEEFAYIKSDDPVVMVKFLTDNPDPNTSLTIDAINSVGATNWILADTDVDFNGSGLSIGDTNYVAFDTESGFPTSVQDTDVYWSWRVVAVGGTPRQSFYFDYTNHEFYVVLDEPEYPLDEPWTDALDYACSWASDQTTASSAATSMRNSLYASGFTYEIESGIQQYGNIGAFDFTGFISNAPYKQ